MARGSLTGTGKPGHLPGASGLGRREGLPVDQEGETPPPNPEGTICFGEARGSVAVSSVTVVKSSLLISQRQVFLV